MMGQLKYSCKLLFLSDIIRMPENQVACKRRKSVTWDWVAA